MRHIAFLIPTIDRIGGAEQQVISLAVRLAKRGWKTTVIALSGTGGNAARRLHHSEIAFLSLEMRKGLADPRGWLRLSRWIAKNQPDVIHAHLPHASLMARWSRIASPVRALLDTVHSPATGGKIRRISYRISSTLPDAVTAVSRTAAEAWLAAGSINETSLVIIPNGVDLDHFRPDDCIRAAVRRELGLSNEFLWIAVGRLDPVKDHSTLLRAFSALPEHARLIVAGDGPLRRHLMRLADDLGLQKRVRLLGFEADVLRWLRAADSFVLCSHYEGMPIALLEACSCALPFVATDISAVREVFPISQVSSLVPVGNVDALAASMQELMGLTVSELRELGRSAQNFVAGRFAIDTVLHRWEALYEEMLVANRQPRRFSRDSFLAGRTFQLQ